MALPTDSRGFLIGVAIVKDSFKKAVDLWNDIKSDTSSIKKFFEGGAFAKALRESSTARPRANREVTTVARVDSVTPNRISQNPANVTTELVVDQQTVTPNRQPLRDRGGRFLPVNLPNGGNNPADETVPENDEDKKKKKKEESDIANAIKNGMNAATQNTENIDPLIKSSMEIKELAQNGIGIAKAGFSVTKGIFKYTGLSWIAGKILKKRGDKIADIANKILNKILRAVERRGGGGDSSGGFLSGLLGLIGIPALTVMLSNLVSIVSPLVSSFAAILKKIPVLGSLIGFAETAVQAFNTSTEEYASRLGVELNGGLAQAIAVRFAGILGDLGNTLTFGLAGKFGEIVSPAINDLVDKCVSAWTSTTESVGEKWDSLISTVAGWFESAAALPKRVKAAAVNAVDATKGYVAEKADKALSVIGKGSAGNKKALMQEMDAQGMTDPKERAMFMAQMDHESGGFRNMEESFKYRSADRIMEVSATARRKGKEAVEAAMKGGEADVAELMYGGRMGNTEKGDAIKYKGRGFTQLTGKAQYAEAGKDLGLDLVNNPDLAADPANAAKIASWYWKKRGISDAAKSGDVSAVTKKINGGLNGVDDRAEKYDKYLAAGTDTPVDAPKASAPPPMIAAAAVSADAAIPSVTSKPFVSAEIPMPSMMASTASPDASTLAVPPQPVQRAIANNASGNGKSTNVTINNPVGQNLEDRKIAQVATGGIGA